MRLLSGVLLIILTGANLAQADENACKNPVPFHNYGGEVIAVCADWMVTYQGEEKAYVAETLATKSRYELSRCDGSSGPIALTLETNSEGYILSGTQKESDENTGAESIVATYEVGKMWGQFKMYISAGRGKFEANCKPFVDKRKDIQYLYDIPKGHKLRNCRTLTKRKMKEDQRCRTAKDGVFKLVARQYGKEYWVDLETEIMWNKSTGPNCKKTEGEAFEIPSKADIELAENHGLREVLPKSNGYADSFRCLYRPEN